MSFFNNLSIKLKLGSAFTLTVGLLLVVSLISYNALNSATTGFSEYDKLAKNSNLLGRLEANMLMVRMNVKDFVITGSDKDKSEYNDYYQKMSEVLKQAKKETINPEQAEALIEVKAKIESYDTFFKEVLVFKEQRNQLVFDHLNINGPKAEKALTQILLSASKDEDMIAAFNAGVLIKHLLLARIYSAKFLDTNKQADADRVAEEFSAFDENIAVLDGSLQNPTRRKLLKEVQTYKADYLSSFKELVTLIYARNKIIKGRLDVIGPDVAKQVKEMKYAVKGIQAKIGSKLEASNSQATMSVMVVSLISVLIGILISFFSGRYISKAIIKLSKELGKAAAAILNISEGLEANARRISSEATQQAASLTETSSSATEISTMIDSNAESTGHAQTLTKNSEEQAARGKSSVSDVKNSIDEIHQSNEDLTVVMNANSKEIEGIVTIIQEISSKTNVINDIVFQTKLLSFNASVEAARAGLHGKGFAVVAEEVGNLAAMSGRAAGEISVLLEKSSQKVISIVEESKTKTTSILEKGKRKVEDGLTRSNECDEILTKLLGNFKEVSSSVANIASSSREQASGVNEITEAIQELSVTTEVNSKSASELLSQSGELKDYSTNLSTVICEMERFIHGGKAEKVVEQESEANVFQLHSETKAQDDNLDSRFVSMDDDIDDVG